MSGWALTDIERRLANIVRWGAVEHLDDAAARVRVLARGF